MICRLAASLVFFCHLRDCTVIAVANGSRTGIKNGVKAQDTDGLKCGQPFKGSILSHFVVRIIFSWTPIIEEKEAPSEKLIITPPAGSSSKRVTCSSSWDRTKRWPGSKNSPPPFECADQAFSSCHQAQWRGVDWFQHASPPIHPLCPDCHISYLI